MNAALHRLVHTIARDKPDIFSRLEGHHHKLFLIDPVNMPFVLCLRACPHAPQLWACRRAHVPAYDAKIAGSFLTLLGMIDGRHDGDALFFTRALLVEGDTEAVVCLRNALDDVDGSIADDIAAFFGTAGKLALKMARKAGADVDCEK